MKIYLYKNNSGNYNISYLSEYFKSRQKCKHSGSLRYLQKQIKAEILHIQGMLSDKSVCVIFSPEELRKLQKDVEIMQRAIEYIERRKTA